MDEIGSGLRNRFVLLAARFAFGLATCILIGNESVSAQGLPGRTCSVAPPPVTSTIYFPNHDGIAGEGEFQRYDHYDRGTAAHTLMVLGPNDLTWDDQPIALGQLEAKLKEPNSKGEHDFAVAVLIQPNLDFTGVEKVLQTFNRLVFCDFSIRNTGQFGSFGKQKTIANRKLRPASVEDLSGHPIVLTISTDRLILGRRGKRPSTREQDVCAVFHGNTYADSEELAFLLSHDLAKLAPGAQRPRVLARVRKGTPWRCVAGVVSRSVLAGVEVVDLQLVTN